MSPTNIPYRTNFRRTELSADKLFFVRRSFSSVSYFPLQFTRKYILTWHIHLTCFIFQRTKYFGGKNFRRTKIFGGQNFRQQGRFSAVLSAEILSDKVPSFYPWLSFCRSVFSENVRAYPFKKSLNSIQKWPNFPSPGGFKWDGFHTFFMQHNFFIGLSCFLSSFVTRHERRVIEDEND